MPDSSRRQAVADVVLPALLVTLQLSLFGPYTIYSGNAAEFTASFWALAWHLAVPAAVLFAVLLIPGLLMRGRVRAAYTAVLFAAAILLWVQANLLVAKYRPLDGNTLDFTIEAWRNKYEIPMWLGVPVLAVLLARPLASIAAFASGVLIVLQTALLVGTTLQANQATQSKWTGDSDAMFDVSSGRNAIHLVLDTFNAGVFEDILEEERPLLDRQFTGFIYFHDHAGAFPTTMVSIPAMLTGRVYRQQEPLPQYLRQDFRNGSLFQTLRKGGYRVDSITEMQSDRESATNFFAVRRPYVSYGTYTQFAAWQLADLSLFRHAPHALRPWIFNNQAWRLQNTFGRDYDSIVASRRYHPVNGAAVLDEFSRRMKVGTNAPLYKFIHVGIPHLPVTLDSDCRFLGVVRYTRETFKGQARCGVARVAAFLDRLRELGVYDDSLIIITADHGNSLPPRRFQNDRDLPDERLSVTAGKALPLLLIKPPKSTGPIRISEAPSAITDLPATIADALGVAHNLPGESILKMPENARRVRVFAAYDWENEDWGAKYFDHLDLLDINGPVRDGLSWTLRDSLYAPESGDKFRVRGLHELQRSSRGIFYQWGGPHVAFHAPPGARAISVTVRSIAPQPQTVTLTNNGNTLGAVTLKDQNWVTLEYPLTNAADPDVQWVHMSVDPPWRPAKSTRDLGVMTRDIKWTP